MNKRIIASSVDLIHFKYLCNECSTFYHKNGNKRIYPKLVYHKHGSGGSLENRIENRSRHCEKVNDNIDIYINDSTIRQ